MDASHCRRLVAQLALTERFVRGLGQKRGEPLQPARDRVRHGRDRDGQGFSDLGLGSLLEVDEFDHFTLDGFKTS
jgi:hypothetical protein